jgi:hypothetical protein
MSPFVDIGIFLLISYLYGGGVWVVYLYDGAVAGVDGHPDPHQRAQAVRIRQRLTLHIVPDQVGNTC